MIKERHVSHVRLVLLLCPLLWSLHNAIVPLLYKPVLGICRQLVGSANGFYSPDHWLAAKTKVGNILWN